MSTNKQDNLVYLGILAVACIIFMTFAFCQPVQAADEWLMLNKVGYYRFIEKNSNQIEFELNEPATTFGEIVIPDNYKGKKKNLDPKITELIDRLVATNNYASFVLSHRRMVLTKYRSESWETLLKEIESIYKELK